MNRKSIFKTSALAAVLVGVVTIGQVAESEEDNALCQASGSFAFDHSLPMSHPVNRCAAQQENGISWLTWFSGRSSSYQFHFLDLLELLSRNTASTSSHGGNAPTDGGQ
ncbi:hypothetical protein [Aestuariibacter salexigens]|uniref:hypothetical protein n=1 Tax=Aestuariibacter salexigens TaxID=226010 RepID=UPI0004075718|nr:hypothetical protein [Aestuariibacter salexigens]